MKKLLKSRTVWTIVIMFLIAGIDGIKDMMNPALFDFLMAGLGVVAVYFKINPSQSYGK